VSPGVADAVVVVIVVIIVIIGDVDGVVVRGGGDGSGGCGVGGGGACARGGATSGRAFRKLCVSLPVAIAVRHIAAVADAAVRCVATVYVGMDSIPNQTYYYTKYTCNYFDSLGGFFST
jgi:hypothetical protein